MSKPTTHQLNQRRNNHERDHRRSPDTTSPPRRRSSWRRFARGRKAIAAGAAVAGLAIGGAGFGAGYAVGDDGSTTQQTSTLTPDQGDGDRGFPAATWAARWARRPTARRAGTGGTTGQAPDFDGDGQPDTDTDPGTTRQPSSRADPSHQHELTRSRPHSTPATVFPPEVSPG